MQHFAWPICIFALGVVFMLLFRPAIAGLVNRAQRIGRNGIECGPPQQPTDTDQSLRYRELMSGVESPAVRELEQVVRQILAEKGPKDSKQLVEVLINNVATSLLAMAFERLHSLIYGSQISLLQRLNSSDGFMPAERVRELYAEVVKTYPDFYAEYTLESYIGFLVSWRVVVANDDGCRITDRGREFLVYLARAGLDTNKVF